MTRSTLLSTLICFSLMTSAAFAEEKKVDLKVQKKVEVQSAKKGPAPGPMKDWIDAENKLIDPLSDKDKESFFILRNKYSIMGATREMDRDISAAVKSCGDKNPDIKAKIDARYKQWQNAVNPILQTAKAQFEKDLEAQKLVDADDAREVFKLQDKANDHSEKQIVKTPVSTPEACNGLLKSMDRNEDTMVTLLQQTLLPESVIRKRASDAAKAKAEKKAKASAADRKQPEGKPATKAE